MNYLKITFLFCLLSVFSCNNQTEVITKPKVFEFGSSMAQIKSQIGGLSEDLVERMDEPMQLPTAKNAQSQLDVSGFEYAGKKRKVELLFADDALDLIWILTEAEEEATFIESFKVLYGEPTHITKEVTFFLDDGVGVRSNPPEILFISDRLKEPYRAFLTNSNR